MAGDYLNPSAFRSRLEAMARKKPDYKKAAEEASAAFTAMKIKKGALHGFFLGSGDRKWAVERLRMWCDLAEQYLSTEMIDQMALRIQMYMTSEALARDGWDAARVWHHKFKEELMKDKRSHEQVQ
jgi:hypothetical protein